PTSTPITNPGGATCVGGTQSAGACICPQGTAPVGSGNNFTCVAGGKPSQGIPCKIGQTRNSAGDCVSIDSVVTCTGGTVVQGVCGCPSGTKPVGSGTTFKCEADKVIRQQQQTSTSGQRPATDNCICPPATMSLVGGVCTTTAHANPMTPPVCASGQKPATDNCLCPPATMSLVGGVCTTTAHANPITPPVCASGQKPATDNCLCPNTMSVVGGVCMPTAVGNPCTPGELIVRTK